MKFTFLFRVVLLVFLSCTTFCYAQPPNDTCLTAEPIVVGVGSCNSILYTNVAATTTGNPATPACWLPNSMSHTVWFSFVATIADVEISTNFGGTLANTQIAVYSGACGSLTLLGCQEDINTGGALLHTDLILHGLTVGNTYYIAIDGNGNTTGTFGVCAQESLPVGPALPTQDCAGSQTLCDLGDITVPDGAGGVGLSQEFPSCFGAPGERSSNWYSFTAATTGTLCFTINPNTSVDYDFAVYNTTASCPGVELTCNWSPTSPITGLGCAGVQCETCITVTAGDTYAILVDRFTAASNSGFTLNFAGTTATFASPNPTFTATTACIGSPTQFTNTTNGNYTYSWNFGDGFTSNIENPSHTYASAGTYSVTLLVTAVPGGCQNSITQSVTVNPLPTVNAGTGGSVCPNACITLGGTTNAVGSIGPVTFNNSGTYAIPDNDPTGVLSPITVSGILPATINNTSVVSVCFDLTHTFDGDLDIFLVSPSGTQIQLSTDNGGGNNDYTGTCFSATATTAITAGTAPFTGTFIPEQAFTLLNGDNTNGTWQLFVRDDAGGDTGDITNWSITLNTLLPAFTWSPTTAMTNATTLSPTVCPAATTTYTLTANNGIGCTTTSQVTVNVSAGPTATIAYSTANYCTSAAIQVVTLNGTGAYTGGTYASTAGLSINATTGAITPSTSTPGPYVVSYTIPASGGCPATTVTTAVTINAPPVAGTLSGNQNICVGLTSIFSSTAVGGTWSSSDITIATINPTSGLVTGIASGTATMTYTVVGTGGCANVTATRTVTVTAASIAGTLSGNQNICVGLTSTFSSTAVGGTWSSSDTTIATINTTSGLVTGVASGTATMTYTVVGTGGCANVTATRTVTVNPYLTPTINCGTSSTTSVQFNWSAVTGATGYDVAYQINAGAVVNVGAIGNLLTYTVSSLAPGDNVTITLTPTGAAGTCFTANTAICTANNCTPPTASISYLGTPFCDTISTSQTVTLNGTGAFNGGVYTSTSGLSINAATGDITPNSSTPGPYTVIYTIAATAGCNPVIATTSITITTAPIAGTLSGNQNICVGLTSTFSSTVVGGTWSSSDTTIATINPASGLITGVAPGTATMTYTVVGTGGCANVTATRIVTINPFLSPTINCGTSSTTSVQFNWSAVLGATGYDVAYQINAGAVVNIGAIGNLLTYSVSSLTPGDNVTITLTPTGAAGTCFTANTAICTANNCSPPTATISYLGTPFCDTTSTSQSVTLNGTGAFTGGVYSSTSGLSINTATGDITPNSSTPGPYTVTYTIAATAGCSPVIATTSITITAAPVAGTLSGNQNICVGLTSTFSSTAVGGTWSSSDTTIATINPASGLVTGIAAGTATMTYTVVGTGGCANVNATRTVTVTAAPIAGTLSGNQNICVGLTSPFLSTAVGGTWSSSDSTIATINTTSGLVTGIAAGTATMTYTVLGTGGCANVTTTRIVTVTAAPIAGTLSGNQNICVGLTSTFSTTAVGGTWSSSDTTIATINAASGLVTGVAAGTATMTYTVVGTGGCANVTATRTVTVTAAPIAGTLSGNQNICVGLTSTFSSTVLGGTWSSSDITVATINSASGLVTGIAAGTATITYTVVGIGGCANVTATRTVTVTAAPIAGTLSGNQNICVGLTSTFSSTTLGGSWSSSDTTIATINAASGIVTGIAAGTATMTYTVVGTGGCANVTATRTVTVTAAPIAGTLSGNQNICVGLTSTFSSTTLGGSWSSSDTTIATINAASGIVTGVASGTATMTYTVLGTGGCANVTATRTVTVTAAPIAGTLSGNQNICVGLTSTFSPTAIGGTWSSSDTTIATINATSGLVTGVASGTATMTYTVVGTGGCANVTVNRLVTVSPFLSPTINCGTSSTTSVQFNWSAVTGATGYDVAYQINTGAVANIGAIGNLLTYSVSSLTPGDNVTITLTPTGAAGTCFTANTAICTANNCTPPTVSISYLGTPFCDTTSTSQSVTLNGTGAFNGGVYASTTGLSINAATGDITPNTSTPGPYTVTYTIAATAGCSPVIATTSITITAAPIAGTLSGNQNICVGLTSTFSSTAVGGTWSSSDTTIATINTTSGLVTGVASGTATMTYTVVGTGGCANVTATRTVTVTASPIAGTLSGNQNICVGLTSTFSSTAVGGTWSSSDTTIATINPASGLVTGIATGTATMTYTFVGTGGCANVNATRTVTVTAAPIAGTLSGNQNICVGLTSTFSSTAVGGTWSSSDITVATINPTSGLVTGVAAGTATMTYTVVGTGGCANVTATRTVTVTAAPIAGTLSGNQNICVGLTSTFSSTAVGGTWSSSDITVATINPTSGLVTGVASGTATMTYTVVGTGGCANISATRNVTVTAAPIAGTLSGNQNICIGLTSTFSSTTLGGTWSSSDTTIATINAASGLVTGVASGTATMTYTVLGTGGCANVTATRTVTVTAAPIAGTLSGNQNICVGLTSTFSSTAVGGTWSSSDTTIATINAASGLVTGVASGTATMTYTVLGTGGCANVTATRTVTVTAAPIAGTLSGNQNICVGLTSTFSSTSVGGTWSSSDTTIATINATSGLVTGVAPGTATMTYTVVGTGGCANVTATRTVTVTAAPVAGTLSGNQNICVGLTSTFSSTAVGGTWSSSDTTIATINAASGLVTGVASGTATMTYTVLGTGGCANVTATRTVTVTAAPIAGTLSGNQNICVGLTSTFSSTAVGGTWSSSDITVATINPTSGLVTGVASGTATMTYTVLGTGGCANISATRNVTVTAAPIAGTLSGNQNICIGLTSTFSSTTLGGTWSSSDTTIATINAASGLVTGVASGTATMTYTVLGTGGCANVTATRTVTVTAAPIAGTLSGNQNICVGLTSTFSSTAVGGTWSSSDINVATINPASGLVNGIAAGTATMTYTVVGTGGCTNVTATRTVTVTAAPIAGTLSGNQVLCAGSSSIFSSTINGGTWVSSDLSVATINSLTGLINGVSAGTCTMTYTVIGIGGCANVSATRTVTVEPTPSVILSTNPINICSGDSPNIILTADFLGTTFSWTAQQNNVIGATLSGTGNFINPTLTSTTTNIGTVIYTAIPTLNNCVGNPSFPMVKVNPKPIPVLNDGIICVDVASGITTQTHILSTSLSNTNYSHLWYFDGNSFSNPNGNNYSANQAGNYSVIATNINTGCISEEVFATVSASIYTTTFTTSVSEAFSDNSYIIINTPSGSGPFQYQLDYGPFQNSNIFNNVYSGLHKISIKDESGCTDLHGEIVILNYPKFFTPNGDTYNDTWNIESLIDIPNSGIYIFDRYGKFIKQISPKGKGWDGTFNGYELPSTDYWFTVDFVDPNSLKSSTFKSHFSLKR